MQASTWNNVVSMRAPIHKFSWSAYVACIGLALAGCDGIAADTAIVGEPSEEGIFDSIAIDDSLETAGEAPVPFATLELAENHLLRFVRIGSDGGGGVFVAEISDGRNPVSAFEIVEAELGQAPAALDVFIAFSEPDMAIPRELLTAPSSDDGVDATEREAGWARAKLAQSSDVMVPKNNSTPACDNTTFTSGTLGGILPNNATWLDRHPWTDYDHYLGFWNNVHHYTPRRSAELARYGIRQWRGKLCYEMIPCAAGQSCHNIVQGPGQPSTYLAPSISFRYRRPGDTFWQIAHEESVPQSSVRQIQWAWFGHNNQDWDWKMQTYKGKAQDWLDYMRSYVD